MGMNMNSKQTVSREEYRRLDNRVTCILQQRWPANEISLWVAMLKDKPQSVVCAILLRRHPRPTSLALPAITPFQINGIQLLWIVPGSPTDRVKT
ncbi:hypothetical protein ACTG18_10765 [Aeromonas hydrophila]|uniref:hypothetical protein n=1 Tax=Aeromonas hydrophila TaxID=644 RepID=UPI003F79D47B